MHLDPFYSYQNLKVHKSSSTYTSPTGFNFQSFIRDRAVEVLSDMKKISDYWTMNNGQNVEAYT